MEHEHDSVLGTVHEGLEKRPVEEQKLERDGVLGTVHEGLEKRPDEEEKSKPSISQHS